MHLRQVEQHWNITKNISEENQIGADIIIFPENQSAYVREKVADSWTPNTIIGRSEHLIVL